MPRLVESLVRLDPQPDEIIVVDGRSDDATVAIARTAGLRVIDHSVRRRASQINTGVAAAASDIICVLHADTALPDDAVAIMKQTLVDPKTALAGFTAILAGPEKVRWATSFHNWIKTWYVPILFRPHLFLRGGRLLFGDHAMFFRREQFLQTGGCDETLDVMEEADLCLKLVRKGRIRLLRRQVRTSDRRVAAWGFFKANAIYLCVGVRWGLGWRRNLSNSYPDIR